MASRLLSFLKAWARLVAALLREPTCCEKHGINCNQGRDCPMKKSRT